MKRIIAAVAVFGALAFAMPVLAEEAAGDWSGVLGKDLKVALHLKKDAAGHYDGFMKSIDQGGHVVALDSIVATSDTLAFHGANAQIAVDGRYKGHWDEARQQWTGLWMQGGQVELNFKRAAPTAFNVPKRPQEAAIAKGRLPYVPEDVAFDNPAAPGVRLAGTFSKPKGAGPFPAVVLVGGSGALTRDEEAYGHKMFVVLADALNRAGVATLRYDKRGVAQSTGDYEAATTADLAGDAQAAVAWLKTRGDVAQNHIGVIGHSEGGIIAPIVAVNDPQVAYIVLLGGVTIRGDQDLLRQISLMGAAEGESFEETGRKLALYRQAFEIIVASQSREEARASLNSLADAAIAAGQIDRQTADANIATLTSPWNYYALRYDPAPVLTQVRVPILALYGELDLQVPPSDNVPALLQAAAGSSDLTVTELPNINHQLQTARTGARSEYGQIEETIAPVVLSTITDWVVVHSK